MHDTPPQTSIDPLVEKASTHSPRKVHLVAAGLLTAMLVLVFLVPRQPAPPPSPARPDTVFIDKADLVSPAFAKETTTWLHAIKLFEGVVYIDGKPPEGALQPWTIQTASEWGVGTDRQDRGLVLFIFRDARIVRAEVGYGLEGTLPDVKVKRLLEAIVVPAFSQGRYEAGLETFIKTVYEGLGGDAEAGRRSLEEASKPRNSWVDIWDVAWKYGARLPPAVWRYYLQGSALDRLGVIAFTLPILFFSMISLVALAVSIQMLIGLPRKLRALRATSSSTQSGMVDGKLTHVKTSGGAKPTGASRVSPDATANEIREEVPDWLRGTHPRWGALILLTPVVLGLFLTLLCAAIAVMVFSMAPDHFTRQGKFGGGGVEVSWPVPAVSPAKMFGSSGH